MTTNDQLTDQHSMNCQSFSATTMLT